MLYQSSGKELQKCANTFAVVTIKLHECHDIQDHLQLDGMFNILFRETTMKAWKLSITHPF